MTGPAHCTKRMGRSSLCVKWLTLSRPASPPGRGQASCGIRLRMRKNSCFKASVTNVYSELSHSVSHSVEPSVKFTWR